jgi:predicted RNA-binding protein YlqC (UPF0109 family)
LVDDPEGVEVREISGERETVIKLSVAPADLGKVIGRQGAPQTRSARSSPLRGIASGRRVVLAIVRRHPCRSASRGSSRSARRD